MFKGQAVVFVCLFIGFQKLASLFWDLRILFGGFELQVNIPYMHPSGMNKTPVV